MSSYLPLIRAAAIAPMRRWCAEQGLDLQALLEAVDLAWVPPGDPLLPIPLRNAALFLCEIARAAGPDAPHRIVNGDIISELGLIGRALTSGSTIRGGFHRVTRTMAWHCTHEIFTAKDSSDGDLKVTDGWAIQIGDDEALHMVQQYVTAISDMFCALVLGPAPRLSRVEMVPHPAFGLSHLRPWLGNRVHPAAQRTLEIIIPAAVANHPIPSDMRSQLSGRYMEEIPSMNSHGMLSEALAILLGSMLPYSRPTIDRIAFAAGLSRRSLQRRLRTEGTDFKHVVENTRASIALARLSSSPILLNELAAQLGYANQETLTRAVQRWTGTTPSRLLSRAKKERAR